MGVETDGEIREPLGGPAGGVRILRRNGDSGIKWEVITHGGEVFTGEYLPPSSLGVCVEIIEFPGRIPDTNALNQRYKGLLEEGFFDTLERDPRTLRVMQHVPVSSNGNGSERWVTRVRRSVPYPSGLFTNSPI